jgi:hypothetical protein
MADMDDFEQLARRAGAELRVPPPSAAISGIEQGRRRHAQLLGTGAVLATIATIAIGLAVWPRSGALHVQSPSTTTATTPPTTEVAPTTVVNSSPTSAVQMAPSTTAASVPTSVSAVTSAVVTGPPGGPSVPVVWPDAPQQIVWTPTTVGPGPYNGFLRSDGYGLTSLNPTTPRIVWMSDDGTTWEQRDLPAGFEALDVSGSRDLLAVVGNVTSASGSAPAVAVSTQGAAWQVSKLDLGGRGDSLGEPVTRIGVSGTRITVVRRVALSADSDTFLRFTGDGGAPFTSQVDPKASALPEGIVVPPIGAYESVEYLGRRDAGDGYFAIRDGAAPSRVQAITRGTATILDDTIATRAFGGRTWLRNCCLNGEPSIGVGQAGLVALATDEPTEQIYTKPTPDLSRLAVAISSNGTDWHVESIGNLVTEQGVDVTQLFVLDGRIVIVVTDRYPQPGGTREAIVLVGQVT